MGIVRAADFDLSKYSEETTFILDTNSLYFVHSGYYLPTDPKCICYSNLIQNIMSSGRTIVVSALNVQELLFGIEGKNITVIFLLTASVSILIPRRTIVKTLQNGKT